MFEATHGSAPKYKGADKVNPRADAAARDAPSPGSAERGDRLESAIAAVIEKGEKVTYDLKPTRDDPTAVGTLQFG